jgi:hypothetical protein
MQTVTIEWRHLDVDGNTCERCDNTGGEVQRAVDALNRECTPRGVSFALQETRLEADALAESNAILIDGHYIETLLPQAERSDSECCSCGDLVGEAVACRTVEFNGLSHETIPAELIRTAACEVAGCCTSDCC